MASRQARGPFAIRSTDARRRPEHAGFGHAPSPDRCVERRFERGDGSGLEEQDAIDASAQPCDVVREDQRGDVLLAPRVARRGHPVVEQEKRLMRPRRQTDDARVGPSEAGDAVEQRGLAGTARAEDPDSFAGSDAIVRFHEARPR